MNSKNHIFQAALMVFGFWWLVLTVYEFGGAPIEVINNWGYVTYTLYYWLSSIFIGFFLGVWWIWFQRTKAINTLYKGKGGNIINGIWSTLGHVPLPAKAPPRIPVVSRRLPVQSKVVQDWIESNASTHPEHVAFFLAVWDVYSAHKDHPATHRLGGHAHRRLWQHCMAVTETALLEADSFKYEGVYAKKRGKAKRLVVAKRNPEYSFDPTDPLIAVVALAHDFGKLEAYTVADNGQILTREEGSSTDHDDDRVFHDSLGARMLARLPEYWGLSNRDRRAINLVVGHYHHPSAFPVDAHGLAIDDRMSALMEFLIFADKKTGMQESGRDLLDEENEITEEQSESIYKAFIDVITEYGRVNGTGNKSTDATLKIAQKHDGLIVVKELELRRLILSKIGWSLEEGEARYRVTMNLLFTLGEKGLLYDHHNGIDFSRYHPMHSVSFRSSKNGQHITNWEPVIIFKPLSTTPELAEIAGLPDFGSRMVINRPLYTHNPGIRDPEVLRDLVRRAFGDDVARSITIAGKGETKTETKAREEKAARQELLQAQSDESKRDNANRIEPTMTEIPQASSSTLEEPQKAPNVEKAIDSPAATQGSTAPDMAAQVSRSREPVGVSTAESVVDGGDLPDISTGNQNLPEEDLPEIGDLDDDPFHDLLPPVNDANGAEGSTGEKLEEFEEFDDFGDFPVGVVNDPKPCATSESQEAKETSGRTGDKSASTPEAKPEPNAEKEEVLIVDRPGVAIPDKDIPNTRKRRTPEEEAAALKALDALPLLSDVHIFNHAAGSKRRKGKKTLSDLDRVKELIAQKAIAVCGNREGHDYILMSDLQKIAPDIDGEALHTANNLPSIEVAPGKVMVGIPAGK